MERDGMTRAIIDGIIVLRPDDGMVLTNGETVTTEVWLGINDSPDNWHEIPDDEIPDENGMEVE